MVAATNQTDYSKFLNDYVNDLDPNFKWHDTGRTFKSTEGGTVHVINVTSIQWFDETFYEVVGGSPIWSHEVAIVVPNNLEYKNMSSIYLASLNLRCNRSQPMDNSFFDLEMVV